MDELWFVQVGEEVAERRLVSRHVRTGVASGVEEARWRVRENDMVNGREILGHGLVVDEVVVSVEDEAWGEGA